MTYSEPRTLTSCTASIPARSTGRARAGLSRSTTAPHKPGSAGPTGLPGARPAKASQTLIRVSTYVTVGGLSLRQWRMETMVRAAETRVPVREIARKVSGSGQKEAVGGRSQPPWPRPPTAVEVAPPDVLERRRDVLSAGLGQRRGDGLLRAVTGEDDGDLVADCTGLDHADQIVG